MLKILISVNKKAPVLKKRKGCYAHNISDRNAARRSITSPPRMFCEVIVFLLLAFIRFPVYVVGSKISLVLYLAIQCFFFVFLFYAIGTLDSWLVLIFTALHKQFVGCCVCKCKLQI